MDSNQVDNVSSEQPVVSNSTISQESPRRSLLWPILLTFLFTAAVFGFGGYYLSSEFPLSSNANETDNSENKAENEDTESPQEKESSPNLELTKNWKTYTNTRYGFSMKYPETWFLEYCGDGVSFLPTGMASADRECPPGDGFPWIGLGVREASFTEHVEEKLSDKAFLYTPREGFIADIPQSYQKYFVEALEPWPGPEKLIDISVGFDDRTIQIYLADFKYEPEIDLMISTISF